MKYTMVDIGNFVVDYKNDLIINPNTVLAMIPVVGPRLYERLALARKKRDVFEKAYFKALNGTQEEQENFIAKMTPVLDDYYSKKGIGVGREK
jgi:hypothetical protein